MCITRVGKAVSVSSGWARVEFFDGRALDNVDVSMVAAGRGDFVEVFGNMALNVLTVSEARSRKKAWEEVRKGAMLASAEASRR